MHEHFARGFRLGGAIWVALSVTSCAGVPAHETAWHELVTPHFEITSNALPVDTVEIAESLERFRSAVLRWRGAEGRRTGRARVTLFRDYRSFQDFEHRLWSDGYFTPSLEGGTMVINVQSIDSARDTVAYHEFVHFLLSSEATHAIPKWYNEGLAEVLSTARRDGDRITLGAPPERVLALAQDAAGESIEQLLSATGFSSWSSESQRLFYAYSWALTHFIHFGHRAGYPDLRGALQRYLAGLRSGTPSVRAFRESFAVEFETLESQLESYLWRGEFPTASVWVGDVPPVAAAVVPLSASEAAYRLGMLALALGPDQRGRAAKLFEVAAADPNHARARAQLVFLDLEGTPAEDHVRDFEMWTRAHPEEAELHLARGKFLVWVTAKRLGSQSGTQSRSRSHSSTGAVSDRGSGTADANLTWVQEGRTALQRAVELDPQLLEAYYWLGSASLVDGRKLRAGARALERVRRDAPWSTRTSLHLAELYARMGRESRARRLLREVEMISTDPGERARARELWSAVGGLEATSR